MAASFTRPLKEDIIKEWLRGKNRDTMAYENGLDTGSTSYYSSYHHFISYCTDKDSIKPPDED